MRPEREDVEALIRDKYAGDRGADMIDDLLRLTKGEPLAYVIGWSPFLGLTVHLDSRPLIPRPETEWWTEQLLAHLTERFGNGSFTFLDLCAGSGAIGLAVLAVFPGAKVSFGELVPEHAALIRKNIKENGLDASRADIRTGDLFAPFESERFDVIASNPPYIPEGRTLASSVTGYEPEVALYSGADGLDLIRRIASEVPAHLKSAGALWMECDIQNIEEARNLLGDRAEIRNDQYGRPRLLVADY